MERPSTHVSLLVQLRLDPANQSAWRDFVSRYGRQIYGWCRQWGVQDADAEDVTQSVLLILAERLRDFHYDPQGSFRAWLKTVTYHAWSKNRESRQRSGQGSGDSFVAQRLDSLEARDDLASKLEAEFDRELLAKTEGQQRFESEHQEIGNTQAGAAHGEDLQGRAPGEKVVDQQGRTNPSHPRESFMQMPPTV
jgi:RNA polymerase sigma factor (sigma-70 family)